MREKEGVHCGRRKGFAVGKMQKRGRSFAVGLLLWVGVKLELMKVVGKGVKMEND